MIALTPMHLGLVGLRLGESGERCTAAKVMPVSSFPTATTHLWTYIFVSFPGPIGPPGKNADNTTPHPFITVWKHYILLTSPHEPVGTPGPPCPPGLCSTGRNTDKPTPHFSILNTGAYVCAFLSNAFYQKGQKVNQVRMSLTSPKHIHTNEVLTL